MVKKQNDINSHCSVERAIDDLRRQLGIVIKTGNGSALAVYPVEFLTKEILSALRKLPRTKTYVLITGARAKSAGISKKPTGMRIAAEELSLTQIQAIADPLAPVIALPRLTVSPAAAPHTLALSLAKYASLLPALLVVEGKSIAPSGWQSISERAIRAYIETPNVDVVATAQASLPFEDAGNAKITSFRGRHSATTHLALVMGNIASVKTPLVRIHSSCTTGDLLGSLRCDCGDQLKLAMAQIAAQGGILIYLHQEGRGIGLTNKLRAYRLQEQGYDTYEANLLLGFEEDERDFSIASAILKKLGVAQIRMLTNNPHKLAAIEKAGIKVKERVPLIAKSGKHNHGYLETKAKKSGHLF